METGTIKSYNHANGFGFIRPDGAVDHDVFVHRRDLAVAGIREVRVGVRLAFLIETDIQQRTKRRAVYLSPLKAA